MFDNMHPNADISAELEPRLAGFVAVCALTMVVASEPARAAEDPAALELRAKTSFALGRYASAAADFEKAFESNAEPALLYNAAQAYRLAGNKERALTLYENYLRVFGGNKEKRAEVESRIDELQKAIEHDKTVTSKPPNDTEPVPAPKLAVEAAVPAVPAAPVPAVPAAPPPAVDAPVVISQPAAETAPPLTSRPWFWILAGGVVAAAAVTVVLVASGGSPKDPVATFGRGNGN
jgi:tetratricopeptide (TPR) repeat protein